MKTIAINLFALTTLAAGCIALPVSTARGSTATLNELAWAFEYDPGGRVTRVTDPAGRDTRIGYDFDPANQRLRKRVRTTADGGQVTHEFDSEERLARMTDSLGSVTYGYDDRSRLQTIQREGAPAITYTYDAQGRVIRRQVGDFFTLNYTYDFLGRLAALDTPAGRIGYDYATGQGTVIRTVPNGVKTMLRYEPNGELREITHGRFRQPNDTRYEVLAEYRYHYRPDGLIAGIDERSGAGEFTKTYAYDTVGRLTGAERSDGQRHTYAYDTFGNRLQATSARQPPQTGAHDWAGRLLSLNGTPVTHDAAGNLTALTLNGAAQTYRYTADNQLAGVGDDQVSYRYDGEGRLIARTAGGAETRFIPDPLSPYWQPLVMDAKDGGRTLIVWDGATPLLQIRNGQPEYLLHDHLGSVRLVADAKGVITQRFDYDPFGRIESPSATEEFAPRYAGLFWDAEAGAYLTLARAYRPDLGRFLQIDPELKGSDSSTHFFCIYAYGENNPMNLIDTNGASAHEPVSFDPHDLWWDSFRRAYAYEYLGPIYATLQLDRIFGERAPLTVNTDPYVRDTVIHQVLGEAGTQTAQDIQLTWLKVKGWREKPQTRPINFRYSLTDQEWKSAENYAYARQWVETGQGLVSLPKGKIAALVIKNVWMPAWDAIHAAFEPIGIPPNALPISGDNRWLPVTRDTRRWWNQAVEDALSSMRAKSASIRGGLAVSWQKPPTLPFQSPNPPDRIESESPNSIHSPPLPPPGRSNFLWNIIGPDPERPPGGLMPMRRSDGPGGGPSPVGGVYLGGAAQTLEGVGLLDGVATDANGNLILLAQGGQDIKLPPLRLDDVVTVFRSVYLHGESPSVTIDPNPENPTGSAMLIRHGPATDGTYVGWVLYQADRLMKGYTLGEDNLTEQAVTSAVPGYAKLLDTLYFGGQHGTAQAGGSWERFWIVPAAARRFASAPDALTLFDVPLKVRTQPMKWEGGQLVDDPKRPPSPGAKAFTEWFTGHYDGIAQEQYLTPPAASGLTAPVPVFTELRRIALLSAIAEKLRDQGVALPFWMRDYPVKPVPFETTAPALEITRRNDRQEVHVFGGVSLSPSTASVQTVTGPATLAKLPKSEQPAAQAQLARAAALAPEVLKAAADAAPLTVRTLATSGTPAQLLTLPGAETRALAPNLLQETDLVVPIEGGGSLSLTRSFHSFFQPRGPWGTGWAWDLPRLETVRIPEQREDRGAVRYRLSHELVTPLNSAHARFDRVAPVPELRNSRLLVPDRPGAFLGLAEGQPDYLTTAPADAGHGHPPTSDAGLRTQMLILRNGERWHFTPDGALVATERGGFRTVYERDGQGRIVRLAGLRGREWVASIRCEYDAAGRLAAATAQRETMDGQRPAPPVTVNYDYDDAGRLTAVRGDEGRTGYRYAGALVTAVTFQGPAPDSRETTLRRFDYTPRGQLLAVTAADGARTEYQTAADATGRTLRMVATDPASKPLGAPDAIRYDAAFRPVEATSADGIKAAWTYPGQGGSRLTLSSPDGAAITYAETPDRRQRTLELAPGHTLAGDYDSAGRLTSLKANGQTLLRQDWLPDGSGRLSSASTAAAALHVDYDEDGLVSRLVLSPPGGPGKGQPWRETRLDPAGRPLAITDNRGLSIHLGYDADGQLQSVLTPHDGQNLGFTLDRDAAGRIQAVKSSWDEQRFTYEADGALRRIDVKRGEKDDDPRAWAEWSAGRLTAIRQFDGGETRFTYGKSNGDRAQLRQITAPNGLTLDYDYDKSSRLTEVSMGGTSALALAYDQAGRVKRWAYRPEAR